MEDADAETETASDNNNHDQQPADHAMYSSVDHESPNSGEHEGQWNWELDRTIHDDD